MHLTDEERQDRVAALLAELGQMASELTGLSQSARTASAGGDVGALCETAELMLQAHVLYAERYRTLLVVRLHKPRTGCFKSGPQLPSL